MFETLLSAAGGGLFGLVGAGLTKVVGYFEQKQQLAHQIKMAKEEREMMAMEIDMAKVKGTIDLELQESENDAKNLQAAISAESSLSGASAWVTDLRGSLRPILTYSLVVCAVGMTAFLPENPWNNDIIFLATTAVTFWFGSRPPSRK